MNILSTEYEASIVGKLFTDVSPDIAQTTTIASPVAAEADVGQRCCAMSVVQTATLASRVAAEADVGQAQRASVIDPTAKASCVTVDIAAFDCRRGAILCANSPTRAIGDGAGVPVA
jgi:hypothetical protein